MSYSVEWHPNTRKFLRKLPKEISARIILKFKEIRKDPFHYLEHYEGADVYKLRIGDYRLLIDVDFSDKLLKIRILDHRGKIYKQ